MSSFPFKPVSLWRHGVVCLAAKANSQGSVDSLRQWLRENAATTRDWLRRRGGILFRGFQGLLGAEAFASVAHALTDRFVCYEAGLSPRCQVAPNVFTSTEHEPAYTILCHQESAHHQNYPALIWFHCERAPESGGQTPLCDMRGVSRDISPSTSEEFRRRGWRIARTLDDHDTRHSKSWRTALGVQTREDAETRMRQWGWEWRWRGTSVDVYQMKRPGYVRHPDTQQDIWFNETQLFHPTAHKYVFTLLMQSSFQAAMRALWRYKVLRQQRPMATYGDRSEIPGTVMHEILQVMERHTYRFDWHEGDTLVLDNLQIAHGRAPFRGARRILVCLQGSPWERDERAGPS